MTDSDWRASEGDREKGDEMPTFCPVATGKRGMYGEAQRGRTKCHALVLWSNFPLQCSSYARTFWGHIPLCHHHERLLRRRGLPRYYEPDGTIRGPLP